MPDTKNFKHLPFPGKKIGIPKYPKRNVPDFSKTAENKLKRQDHYNNLNMQVQRMSRFWQDRKSELQRKNLNVIPGGVPFLLEIDPTSDVDFLRGLGFEIVCDLDEGFIVVSSEQTDLSTFSQKIAGFLSSTYGTGNVARVYALNSDDDRLKRILSNNLYSQWNTIDDNVNYTVELAISCDGLGNTPSLPNRKQKETEDDYNNRIEQIKKDYFIKIDNIAIERQTQIENIVNDYSGSILSGFVDNVGSFSLTVQISGRGLRDIVLNYAYIFEVALKSEVFIDIAAENTSSTSDDINIIEPDENSPIVCVIDSGIQENHRYLQKAILSKDSFSLIPEKTDISDEVNPSGHGTRVAGAVLYPKEIPVNGSYQLPCFIRNVKILDANNGLSDEISREHIIETVVQRFYIEAQDKTKIFNHSIGERKPFYELKHMSAWAAKIDEVSYKNDILFIQAAGNISSDVIKAHIQAEHSYPNYLGLQLTQISNPAQSLQAITVGSVSDSDFETDDIMAIGKNNEPSSFTRVGPGIWDSIKPDVVEYGGTHAINKSGNSIVLTTPEDVCQNLIRRSPEGPAFSKDGIGTSFATPKVTYIASEIQKVLPDSPALLYRALIAQSARWPQEISTLTPENRQKLLRCIGYGIPNVDRATENNKYRATLATMDLLEIGDKEAHIFTINIPQELRDLGEDYNILIEVTLSYASMPKRTRRGHKGYLSTWLDWVCNKKNESKSDFEARIFEANSTEQDDGQFSWKIHERRNSGSIKDFSRSRQTLQKDWCLVNSSQLNESFCIAVRGHEGWGGIFKAKYCLAISFEAIDQNIEIYEPIRVSNQVEIEISDSEIRVEV